MILLLFKDSIPNLAAGYFLHKKGLIKKGDRIKVGLITGKVIEVGAIETKLKSNKGDTIFIPNSILYKEKIIKLKRFLRTGGGLG